MRTVVITGASSGIGWATSKLLLARGFRVFGSVRGQEDAARLRQDFGSDFIPLIFDVTDQAAVRAAALEVRASLAGGTLFGLVNNAGIAVPGPVLELPPEDFRRQLDVNLLGPLIATQAFGPLLGADPSLKGRAGRIIMVSSDAGKNGNPLMAAYSASKHGLEGLSESLRREMLLFGIGVVIVAPGVVKTPIWKKAEQVDLGLYRASPFLPALERVQKMLPRLEQNGLPAETIAETIARGLTAKRPKLRYQITPHPMRHWILSMLPKRKVDGLIAKRLYALAGSPDRH